MDTKIFHGKKNGKNKRSPKNNDPKFSHKAYMTLKPREKTEEEKSDVQQN